MKNSQGTIFLEIVISIGVLALLVHAIASLIIASYDVIGLSRTRISARHIANERMEMIRNLPYDQVAVAGGVPAGNLPQLEVINLNGLDYSVLTSVVYVDDAFDDLAPDDSIPTDYKRVRVDVSWNGTFASDATVTLITDVAPVGVEANQQGGGTLAILVFNSQAQPVDKASVRIENYAVDPTIDLTIKTDDNGRVTLPGVPACFECYQITVSKSEGFKNYSQDKTYSVIEVANPSKPHATVTAQAVTNISFAIDRLSKFTFNSTLGRDNNYAKLTNQFFQLTGAKSIGTDELGAPVYKYDELLQTQPSGKLVVNNIEWDTYTLTLPAENWDLAGVNPMSPISLLADTDISVQFASVAHSDNSLLVTVTDSSQAVVPGALTSLFDAGSYSEELLTGEAEDPDYGQAFFSLIGTTGEFTLEASKSGYQNASTTININGNTQETIVINAE